VSRCPIQRCCRPNIHPSSPLSQKDLLTPIQHTQTPSPPLTSLPPPEAQRSSHTAEELLLAASRALPALLHIRSRYLCLYLDPRESREHFAAAQGELREPILPCLRARLVSASPRHIQTALGSSGRRAHPDVLSRKQWPHLPCWPRECERESVPRAVPDTAIQSCPSASPSKREPPPVDLPLNHTAASRVREIL
jgi:hypothetical protein